MGRAIPSEAVLQSSCKTMDVSLIDGQDFAKRP